MGLAVGQPAGLATSWTTLATSGVRSADPVSLASHGPGNHGSALTVLTRSLRLLSVLAKVCALVLSSPTMLTSVAPASSELAVNCTEALTIVAPAGIPTPGKRSPTMLVPRCRALPPRVTLAPSCSASSELAPILTVFVSGAASQWHPQV